MVGAGPFVAKTLSRLYFADQTEDPQLLHQYATKTSWAEGTLLAAEAARSPGPDDTRHPVSELPFGGAVREFLTSASRMRSPSVPAIAAAGPLGRLGVSQPGLRRSQVVLLGR